MKYTLSRKKEKKISKKRHFCLSFSLLYLFIRSYKFALIETCVYDMAHEKAMSSKIRIRVMSKATTSAL